MAENWLLSGRVPPVKAVMTPFPYWVDVEAAPKEARMMMAEHGIRHLPVKEGGRLVGVVSERNLERSRRGDTVGQVMGSEVYVVDLNERLDRVLLRLAEKQVGSALVVRDGRLAGIFTTSDACRVFGDCLRQIAGDGGPIEVA